MSDLTHGEGDERIALLERRRDDRMTRAEIAARNAKSLANEAIDYISEARSAEREAAELRQKQEGR